jgi:hypothetical protein
MKKLLVLACVVLIALPAFSQMTQIRTILNAKAHSNSAINTATVTDLGAFNRVSIGITTTTAAEYDNISFDYKAPGSSTFVEIDSIATFALGTAGANYTIKAVRNTVVDKFPFAGGQCRIRLMHKSSGNTAGFETVKLYLSN